MTRVLVVDDQELLRRGIRMLLEAGGGVEVVGEAADGLEALAMIAKHSPDVVLADARMPGMDGVGLVRECASRFPGLPVLILTTFDDDDLVREAVAAGAAGFLLKDVSPEVLAQGVRDAQSGGVVIDPRVAGVALRAQRSEPAPDPLAVLTPTERVVATHVAQGLSNREIADELTLAEGTVKNHVSSLLTKLEARDRTALALRVSEALREG